MYWPHAHNVIWVERPQLEVRQRLPYAHLVRRVYTAVRFHCVIIVSPLKWRQNDVSAWGPLSSSVRVSPNINSHWDVKGSAVLSYLKRKNSSFIDTNWTLAGMERTSAKCTSISFPTILGVNPFVFILTHKMADRMGTCKCAAHPARGSIRIQNAPFLKPEYVLSVPFVRALSSQEVNTNPKCLLEVFMQRQTILCV